ncbi:MAG: DNA-3-methyladenine glycosylase 2 family protein [Chromatiales bacterium]|nr:DNA-3-methyladenine glycosylase 2 family protein [Chromatiales bacterium]
MALHFGASAVTATIEARGKVPEEAGRAAILLLVRLLGRTTATLAFEQRARTDTAVKRLLADRLGLGISLTHTPFDAAVWSIIGQQISLPFAYQMLRSATQLAGAQAPGGLRTMPLPERLADMTTDALRACKFSASKARYLIDIAGLVSEGSLTLDDRSRTSAKRLFERLLAVRGLGPWSVNYIMMRGFGLTDCAPIGDAGLRRALNHFLGRTGPMDAQSMAKAMEPFAPHRSLATFHLWRSLDD